MVKGGNLAFLLGFGPAHHTCSHGMESHAVRADDCGKPVWLFAGACPRVGVSITLLGVVKPNQCTAGWRKRPPTNPPTNARNQRLSQGLSNAGPCDNLGKTGLFEAMSKRSRDSEGLRNRGLEVRALSGVLYKSRLGPQEVLHGFGDRRTRPTVRRFF
jgi:hypothetical protein